MENCKRCGAELFDFYCVNYHHSHVEIKETFCICPNCFNELKSFISNFKKDDTRSTRGHLSFTIPDDYKIME